MRQHPGHESAPQAGERPREGRPVVPLQRDASLRQWIYGMSRIHNGERETSREQGWSVPSWEDPVRVPVWIAGREFVFLTTKGNYESKDGEIE